MTDFLKQSLLHTKVSTNQSFTLSNQILIKQHAAGILEVIPPKAKNAMIISCGVHGNETIPLELVDHLVNSILCEKFHPSWQLLFIIAHPKAIAHHKRYLDENLNRLFKKCGSNLLAAEAAYSTIEQKIAHKLQFYMQQFYLSLAPDIEPWHLDLHSTLRASQHPQFAVIPVSATKHAKKLNELSQHAKLNATLAATQASPTMSWWSAQYFDAIAMTVELGQVSPLYQNDLSPYQGFVLALQAMICDESLPMLDKQKRSHVMLLAEPYTNAANNLLSPLPIRYLILVFFQQVRLLQ